MPRGGNEKVKTHELKVWPLPFAAVVAGDKNWEFRDNTDRNFEVGDEFVGREWDPKTSSYAGRSFTRRITYVLHQGFGLPDGYVILSLEVPGVPQLRARTFAQAAEIARKFSSFGAASVFAAADALEEKAQEVLAGQP